MSTISLRKLQIYHPTQNSQSNYKVPEIDLMVSRLKSLHRIPIYKAKTNIHLSLNPQPY